MRRELTTNLFRISRLMIIICHPSEWKPCACALVILECGPDILDRGADANIFATNIFVEKHKSLTLLRGGQPTQVQHVQELHRIAE